MGAPTPFAPGAAATPGASAAATSGASAAAPPGTAATASAAGPRGPFSPYGFSAAGPRGRFSPYGFSDDDDDDHPSALAAAAGGRAAALGAAAAASACNAAAAALGARAARAAAKAKSAPMASTTDGPEEVFIGDIDQLVIDAAVMRNTYMATMANIELSVRHVKLDCSESQQSLLYPKNLEVVVLAEQLLASNLPAVCFDSNYPFCYFADLF
jgi:hypothetical protein